MDLRPKGNAAHEQTNKSYSKSCRPRSTGALCSSAACRLELKDWLEVITRGFTTLRISHTQQSLQYSTTSGRWRPVG